jgi:hypothetical protein
MSIRERWTRLESEVADSAMREGWHFRCCAVLFVRVWMSTFAVFAILTAYAAALWWLGHEAACRQVSELAMIAVTFGLGAFVGVVLCEAEGRK